MLLSFYEAPPPFAPYFVGKSPTGQAATPTLGRVNFSTFS